MLRPDIVVTVPLNYASNSISTDVFIFVAFAVTRGRSLDFTTLRVSVFTFVEMLSYINRNALERYRAGLYKYLHVRGNFTMILTTLRIKVNYYTVCGLNNFECGVDIQSTILSCFFDKAFALSPV